MISHCHFAPFMILSLPFTWSCAMAVLSCAFPCFIVFCCILDALQNIQLHLGYRSLQSCLTINIAIIFWDIYLFHEWTKIVLLSFPLQYGTSHNHVQKCTFVLNFQPSYLMVISLSSQVFYSWQWLWGYYSEMIWFFFILNYSLVSCVSQTLYIPTIFWTWKHLILFLYLVSMKFLLYSSSLFFSRQYLIKDCHMSL